MASTLYTKAKTDELLATKAPASHTHTAAEIAGTLSRSQLGSGAASAGTYVDGGTGAWTALPAQSGATINDTAASTTTTYSSNKVNSLLGTKADSSALAAKADASHTHAGMVTMTEDTAAGTVTLT